MKNLFIKNDNSSLWIAALALGAATTGVITYLFFKRKNELAEAEKERLAHAGDYLKPHKKKKHKTDLHELQDIVEHHE